MNSLDYVRPQKTSNFKVEMSFYSCKFQKWTFICKTQAPGPQKDIFEFSDSGTI
jgi:hypothetical protein